MVPAMVLVADGSHDSDRMDALLGLAEAAAERNEAPIVPAFDGRVNEVIGGLDGPMVAVPAFLAGEDGASAAMFAGLDLANRFDSCATEPLGAIPSIVANLARRLEEAGWEPGDSVVLAADGAVDTEARKHVATAARMLSRYTDTPVQVGYVGSWAPSVSDAVARLRRNGQNRVAVATWQLVRGADHERLLEMGATAVAGPLWPAEFVVEALLAQHRAATARLSA